MGQLEKSRMRPADPKRFTGPIDQSFLARPSSGLASFIDNPAAAKRAGALPLAPPSRPRGFEEP